MRNEDRLTDRVLDWMFEAMPTYVGWLLGVILFSSVMNCLGR